MGDLSDAIKFGLLRALVRDDRTLGIAWYYVSENDGDLDGLHLEWQRDPAWRNLDIGLHAALTTLSDRSVASLEVAPMWPPGTLFHRDPVPGRSSRLEWAACMRLSMDQADVVFLDPDNGLGFETRKHATYSELAALRRAGRSIVFITFPGRSMKHERLVDRLHERLRVEANIDSAITLRTNVSVPSRRNPRNVVQRQRWFTIVDADLDLVTRAKDFASALATIPSVKVHVSPSNQEAGGGAMP